jgi:hypothetical protein
MQSWKVVTETVTERKQQSPTTTQEDLIMKKHDAIKSVWIMTVLVLSTTVFAAGKPTPVSLTPEGKKLEAHYSKMLADLKQQITRLEPKVEEKK